MEIQLSDITSTLDEHYLHLIIMPTESCNLRCIYCYEDFKINKMPTAVIDGLKSLIKKRAIDLKQLNIGWFGGEPLLGMSVIREIATVALECAQNHKQFTFTSSISTNAVKLTDRYFNELIQLGVKSFQISLDGYKDAHNKTRVAKDGRGTFDIIWDNLIRIRESKHDFKINLRIHMTRNNIESIKELINHVNKEFGKDDRFNVYFKAIEFLGGAHDSQLPLLSSTEAQQEINEFKTMVSQTNLVSDDRSSPKVCYAAKGNSFVVRADGRIGKCTVALNDEKNCIGYISSDGKLNIDIQKYRPWIAGLLSGNSESAKCPLSFV